jgi:hypothetical protein
MGEGMPSNGVYEHSSARPSHPGLFEPVHERALHPQLRDVAGRLPGAARGVLVIEDFRGPWGVPDLCALVFRPSALAARFACKVPPLLAERDAKLVSAAGRAATPEELGAKAGVRGDQLRRRIQRLVRVGALVRRDGLLRRAEGLEPIGRVWALEAKVEDWRAGLGQTHGYRLWADGAVLVLGRLTSPADVVAREAQQLGLAVYADDRWLVRPRLRLPDDGRRLWASEHVAAALWGEEWSSTHDPSLPEGRVVLPGQYPSALA